VVAVAAAGEEAAVVAEAGAEAAEEAEEEAGEPVGARAPGLPRAEGWPC